MNRRPAPAEDPLIHVSNCTDEIGARSDQLHECALGNVGVLVLVEEHVAEALTEAIEDVRTLPEHLVGEHDLVAEVDRISLQLELGVVLERGDRLEPFNNTSSAGRWRQASATAGSEGRGAGSRRAG